MIVSGTAKSLMIGFAKYPSLTPLLTLYVSITGPNNPSNDNFCTFVLGKVAVNPNLISAKEDKRNLAYKLFCFFVSPDFLFLTFFSIELHL